MLTGRNAIGMLQKDTLRTTSSTYEASFNLFANLYALSSHRWLKTCVIVWLIATTLGEIEAMRFLLHSILSFYS